MIPIILVAVMASAVPAYNVEKGCQASYRAMQNDLNVKSCVDDENEAKAKIEKAWWTYPPAARQECAAVQIGGFDDSYIELLTCFQMRDWKLHLNDIGAADR